MNILTQKYSFFRRKFMVVYCFGQKYNDMLSHSLWHSCGTEYGLMYLHLLFNKHVCRIIAINSKHRFKHLCSAICSEDIPVHCTYGIHRFIILEQINKKICLDEYLIIQILAHMVSVMMADEPTDAFNLMVGKSAESC